jgi:ketosteroid isomerase-like protein
MRRVRESMTANEVILEVIHAIEQRDIERFVQLCSPDVEFVWPPSLPYGSATGLGDELGSASSDATLERPSWIETWDPLQPDDDSRLMDPHIVGELANSVVVLWYQRGVDQRGRRLNEAVLGLYEISDSKLVRGQMFYFDSARVGAFLSAARDA